MALFYLAETVALDVFTSAKVFALHCTGYAYSFSYKTIGNMVHWPILDSDSSSVVTKYKLPLSYESVALKSINNPENCYGATLR